MIRPVSFDFLFMMESRYSPIFSGPLTIHFFLWQVNASDKAWVVITDENNEPSGIMDADGFLRHTFLMGERADPHIYCHRPVIVRNRKEPLGKVLAQLSYDPELPGDHLISNDTVLLWTDQPRLITGADLLGRLLRGIVQRAQHPQCN